ncbi:MAG: hypothetical protein ACK457_00025, partial [Flavobacteriia bacterium]
FAGSISYYTPKWDLNIGQGVGLRGELLNYGGGAGGVGISGAYRLLSTVSLSAFYSRDPGLISSQGQSYGASVSYRLPNNNFMASAGYTRQVRFGTSAQDNFFSGFRYRFLKNHNLSFRIGQTIAQFNSLPQPTTVNATNWFFQYSGSYFKNRLNQSISFGRNTTISPFNNQLNTSSFISSSSSIQSKAGYGITLSGSYLQNEIITNTAVNNLTTIPVNLQFSIPRGSKFFSLPSFYYVFTDDGLGKLNNGGVNIGFSHYDYEKNVRASANFMGGYNFYTDSVQYKPLFNANAFAMIGWRTLSVSIRYMYGPMGLAGIRSFLKYDSRYPQYIFNSVNYQYVFKQTRFVGEISLNHSWNNQTWANNIFVAPN